VKDFVLDSASVLTLVSVYKGEPSIWRFHFRGKVTPQEAFEEALAFLEAIKDPRLVKPIGDI